MKRKDFEAEIRDMGFYLIRSKKHLVFAHDEVDYRVVIPTGKEINKMICRRLFKEIDQAFEAKEQENAGADTN